MLGNFTPQGWVLKAWRMTLAGGSAGDYAALRRVDGHGGGHVRIGAVMFRRRFA